MRTKVFFDNSGDGCRLEITHDDGHKHHVLFENESSMVNYCHENGIAVKVSDCYEE